MFRLLSVSGILVHGIHSEILPRLFEKFATKSYQGTGLGLFISKGIIQAHGGKIWAENNKDNKDGKRGGATFRFSLPISKENSSHHTQKQWSKSARDKRMSKASLVIMLNIGKRT